MNELDKAWLSIPGECKRTPAARRRHAPSVPAEPPTRPAARSLERSWDILAVVIFCIAVAVGTGTVLAWYGVL